MSGLSLYAAICRGVSPCFSLASGEAPALMSASAAERPAPAAAQCRGVMPSLSALSAGAPRFPFRRAGRRRAGARCFSPCAGGCRLRRAGAPGS